jgi:cystathionine beta-lyase/cystathionine gamma-synthase
MVGRDPEGSPVAIKQDATVPLAPPLVPSAVFKVPDLDALDAILDHAAPGFVYARDGHPNAQQLAQELARLESADWACITPSGMAALSAVLLAVLRQGDHVVASNRLYGKSTQLLSAEVVRFGVETTHVDVSNLDEVKSAISDNTKVVLVETLSNPLLRVSDVPALAQITAERKCLLVVDNTFASPILLQPLHLGADFVIESLTKIIGGHSDVTLGVVAGSSRTKDLQAALRSSISTWGFAAPAFDCWLVLRSLATLELRVRQACQNAMELARWLADVYGLKVTYPGLDSHPDHALANNLLGKVPGHMLCFEVPGGRDGVNRFLRSALRIPFSPSLGDAVTTLSHPATTSHRYVPATQRQAQGISDGLLRLSVGIEPVEEIKHKLVEGLESHNL